MRIQWDPIKNATNLLKHGISFPDVIDVLQDPHAIVTEHIRNNELRCKVIGRGNLGVIVMIHTEISDDIIRIISARKAEPFERRQYSSTRRG